MARFIILVLLPLFFFAQYAVAEENQTPSQNQDCLMRTWKGAIGSVPIMMEFTDMGPNQTIAGRYYYRTNLVDLLLVHDETEQARWKEIDSNGRETGRLTLTCTGNSLTGEWQSLDGARTLPISASAKPIYDYSKTRLDAVKHPVTERKAFAANHYELLKVQGYPMVTGLRLIGEGAGIAKINHGLMEDFISNLDNAMTCQSYGRLSRGDDHGFEEESQWDIVAWNRAFVVIKYSSSGYCGGAHPHSEWDATTYSLATGDHEDMSKWFVEDGVTDPTLSEFLFTLYFPNSPGKEDQYDMECREVFQLDSRWPTSTGMSFHTGAPYGQHMCIDDIVVPYQKLLPYLTPYGKTRVKYFLKH